jgi:hypothetical protein
MKNYFIITCLIFCSITIFTCAPNKNSKFCIELSQYYDSLGNKKGTWIYKDENNDTIKIIDYFTSIDYYVKYYHNKQVIYMEKYRQGELVEKISFGSCDNIQDRVAYIYRSNCAGCHYMVDSLNFSQKNLKEKNIDEIIMKKSIKENKFHSEIFIYEEDYKHLADYIKHLKRSN